MFNSDVIPGDVVGPGFFVDYLDAEVTLRKPFGSGEQNAYNFAYTLYNLLYLKATNQLRTDVRDKALAALNIGKLAACDNSRWKTLAERLCQYEHAYCSTSTHTAL